MKIVKVTWSDSNMFPEQLPQDYEWFYEEIESVGFLIEKNKDFIVLARELMSSTEVRGTIVIPMVNVIKICYLNNSPKCHNPN